MIPTKEEIEKSIKKVSFSPSIEKRREGCRLFGHWLDEHGNCTECDFKKSDGIQDV